MPPKKKKKKKNRKWKASGSATSVVTTPGNPTAIAVVGTGQAAHLGNSTFHSDVLFNPDDGSSTSTIVITAANGDKVCAKGVGQGAVNHVTIEDGDGQFTGASGSFTSNNTDFDPPLSERSPTRRFKFKQWGTIAY